MNSQNQVVVPYVRLLLNNSFNEVGHMSIWYNLKIIDDANAIMMQAFISSNQYEGLIFFDLFLSVVYFITSLGFVSYDHAMIISCIFIHSLMVDHIVILGLRFQVSYLVPLMLVQLNQNANTQYGSSSAVLIFQINKSIKSTKNL